MPAAKVHSLLGEKLFRENESIFIHKSSSLPLFIETNHEHDFIEITYVISGECTHIEYDKHFSAKKGDLFIVNYGVPHQNIIDKKNSEPYIAYDCAFKPDFIDSSLSEAHDFLQLKSSFMFGSLFNQSNPDTSSLHLSGGNFYEFEKLMTNMYEEYEHREKGYYALLRSYLTELIIKIFRKIDKNENITLKTKQEYYINLAIQYIENNYMKKISLEDIAYRSFLSKSYFSQLFKEVTGTTFSAYCQKVRIEKACQMLTTTNDTIQSIAEKVGYTDMKFFYNVFKRLTGEIPGDYQKNHR
ncbi:MAG: AraC family transcriptional regulator [Candidatus Gallimonas sp.]